ncbi:MAG: hypothetical protein HKP58_14045 [Desulfatitalea sp.]|nr:hypothetical protein [Desulfatitalea sp.]NNK01525.1 hypothetical protein [Desulfatitalea sp.]
MDDKNNIALDTEAQRLFEQFGGLQHYDKKATLRQAQDLAQSLLDEQKRHDATRILLVQAAWLISRYLAHPDFGNAESREVKAFTHLAKYLVKLGRIPGHLGFMMIRYRGVSADPDIPEKYDYEVVLGHTMVDSIIVRHTARRNGSDYAKLPDRLLEACTVMADYGVNNIYVRLTEDINQNLAQIRLCLKILSGFRKARHGDQPITVKSAKGALTIPVINDENMFPDPNLTLLSGLNRLSPTTMASLVDKIDQWLRKRGTGSDVRQFAGIYNAALNFPKISAKVKTPPVELNNIKWLISETEDEEVSTNKVGIAKLALEMAGASPQTVTKMIQSIYGDDYAKVNKLMLGERLHLSSNLLDAAQARSKEQQLTQELISNLQSRLDQVKDQVIDDLQVVEDTGEANKVGREKPKEMVNSEIYRMVSFYKGRSHTRKKMKGMVHQAITFTDQDYAILAKDFRISKKDAEALVGKLKSCFNAQGRFSKRAFAEAVDHFRLYEQKIFQFLWHHMKDVVLPPDRTAFLNALQALTTQMDQPKKAFKILLEDFCNDPADIQFSDNKAIMLANLIIHRDKSMTDYDITPEDVVLSRHHIDTMVAQYAAWRIEKEHEAFSTKLQTIHTRLNEALQVGHTGGRRIPAMLLLNLERELYIFLSLVECETGKTLLKSAVFEYGNPGSRIFQLKESQNHLSALLQNLRVSLRGVGSVGGMSDIAMLESIKTNEETFSRLKNDRQHRAQTRNITEWVDEAIKLIKFRA